MTSNEIREKYLKFFEDRGHVRIDPSPLVLKDDPTTLFTSSGMQQLVPYLKGEKPHPEGKRLVDSQPSLRLQDIEEVGDNRHTTFFEMLGNWSLGDYFKKEQLAWCWEFFTKELGIPKEKLWISVFEGTKEVPKDTESIEIWKSLGVSEERIKEYGVEKNWWSRSGTPDEMPAGEIGGPDSEVFYEFDVPHDRKYGANCHPNCECGRFLEIGNSVFMEYKKNKDGSLSELHQKNVDFGAGLERIAATLNDNPDVFKIDLFWPLIGRIQSVSNKSYLGNERPMRIIADHLRASVMIMADGIYPSNKKQGDVLRSLIHGAVEQISGLGVQNKISRDIAEKIIELYKNVYPKVLSRKNDILNILDQEELRFHHKVEIGLPKFEAEYLKKFRLDNDTEARSLIEYNVKPFGITSDDFLTRVGSYTSLPSVAAGTATFYGTSTYGLPFQMVTPVIKENWSKANIVTEIEKADNVMEELDKEQSRKRSADIFKAK